MTLQLHGTTLSVDDEVIIYRACVNIHMISEFRAKETHPKRLAFLNILMEQMMSDIKRVQKKYRKLPRDVAY